jgi:hypothetical protein
MTMLMMMREARLRPEWAELYPGVEPGVWMRAARLMPRVLRNRLRMPSTREFVRRVLTDAHFEFRGGHRRDEAWTGILTRVGDL